MTTAIHATAPAHRVPRQRLSDDPRSDIQYRDTLRLDDGDYTVTRVVVHPAIHKGAHRYYWPERQYVCTSGTRTRTVGHGSLRADQHYRGGQLVIDLLTDRITPLRR